MTDSERVEGVPAYCAACSGRGWSWLLLDDGDAFRDECGACSGFGYRPVGQGPACEACNGAGFFWLLGHRVRCERCGGDGGGAGGSVSGAGTASEHGAPVERDDDDGANGGGGEGGAGGAGHDDDDGGTGRAATEDAGTYEHYRARLAALGLGVAK